jgi:phosphoenolpyruvate phosphomutase
MNKTRQFRELLESKELEYLMEAHNGLSARIVEESGFRGIWASGLSISAALGVRDNNEASWTQVLEVVEFMSDATEIPILLDGDTGYGNFNNMRRLVRKLEQRGIAAVCIEDKLFPKTNSFIGGDKQELADMEEFAGKIRAAKDGQTDPDFSVVARLEGFIAGWGLDEMLRRASAYAEAGADALLIHSKKSTPEEIVAFARAWDQACPLIIVPTMYYRTPVEVFEAAGIDLVIWANHNLRACISAMQETSRQIYEERSLRNVEDRIPPVKEVFRLQNAQELAIAEDLYLPIRSATLRAIVLASPRGEDLRDLTNAKPKTMIEVNGNPILHKLVAHFRREGIDDIVVVRGYKKDSVHADGVQFVDNDNFSTSGEVQSLNEAYDSLNGELLISFGDILFRSYILDGLLEAKDDIVIAVDAAWEQRGSFNGLEDFVRVSRPYSLEYDDAECWLEEMEPTIDRELVQGEWIGLVRTSSRGTEVVKSAVAELSLRPDAASLQLYDLFNHLVRAGESVRVVYHMGHWLDVDSLEDLARAYKF